MKQFLFGADLGTGGVKALLLDPKTGESVKSDLFEYPLMHDHPLWAEQNPHDWWNQFCQASRQIMERAGECELLGIAISSQGCGMVSLDSCGQPIGNAFTWMDARTSEEVAFLKNNFAAEIAKVNDNPISTMMTTANFLWLKEHEPERYQSAAAFCGVTSYINYLLTGKLTVNPSEASMCHLYNYKTHQFSTSICQLLRIDSEKLPPSMESTSICGFITEKASSECGLPAGTPVCCGAHDNLSAALGMGVHQAGQVCFSMGTAGNMGILIDHPFFEKGLMTEAGILWNTWLSYATMGNNGACLKWLSEEIFSDEENTPASYDILLNYAEQSSPGSGGIVFLPYLAGELSPLWDEKARACFIGMTHRTTKQDLVRAVLEGVCYAVRQNLLLFEKAGCHMNEIRISGGPTKSPLWMQIMADITGHEIQVTSEPDIGPVGDAILAAFAVGHCRHISEVHESVLGIQATYIPNPDNKKIYDHLFEVYRNLYPKLHNEFISIFDL